MSCFCDYKFTECLLINPRTTFAPDYTYVNYSPLNWAKLKITEKELFTGLAHEQIKPNHLISLMSILDDARQEVHLS